MSKHKDTSPQSAGNHDPHLVAIQDRVPNYTLRRIGAGILLTTILAGAGVGLKFGYDAISNLADTEQDSRANASPGEDDICVVEAKGREPGDISTRVLGDEFADGTEDILKISYDASAVMEEHPGEGVAICRDPNSNDLGANHVVAPENVRSEQIVTERQFDEAGGISDDVTLGQ